MRPGVGMFARWTGWPFLAFNAIATGGAIAVVAGWRPGAFVMLAAFLGVLLAHVGSGIRGYRSAMDHPWPTVATAADDDEW